MAGKKRKTLMLAAPSAPRHGALNMRVPLALLERMDEVLDAYREAHPEARAGITRTWLTTSVLERALPELLEKVRMEVERG